MASLRQNFRIMLGSVSKLIAYDVAISLLGKLRKSERTLRSETTVAVTPGGRLVFLESAPGFAWAHHFSCSFLLGNVFRSLKLLDMLRDTSRPKGSKSKRATLPCGWPGTQGLLKTNWSAEIRWRFEAMHMLGFLFSCMRSFAFLLCIFHNLVLLVVS